MFKAEKGFWGESAPGCILHGGFLWGSFSPAQIAQWETTRVKMNWLGRIVFLATLPMAILVEVFVVDRGLAIGWVLVQALLVASFSWAICQFIAEEKGKCLIKAFFEDKKPSFFRRLFMRLGAWWVIIFVAGFSVQSQNFSCLLGVLAAVGMWLIVRWSKKEGMNL